MKNFCITLRFFDRDEKGTLVYSEGFQRSTFCSISEVFRKYRKQHQIYSLIFRESDVVFSRELACSALCKVRSLNSFSLIYRAYRRLAIQRFLNM